MVECIIASTDCQSLIFSQWKYHEKTADPNDSSQWWRAAQAALLSFSFRRCAAQRWQRCAACRAIGFIWSRSSADECLFVCVIYFDFFGGGWGVVGLYRGIYFPTYSFILSLELLCSVFISVPTYFFMLSVESISFPQDCIRAHGFKFCLTMAKYHKVEIPTMLEFPPPFFTGAETLYEWRGRTKRRAAK